MIPTYVTTSTSDTNCAGTMRVSSDNFSSCVKMSSEPTGSNSNKTFTLDPYDNLTVGTTYKTRVTTGVKDTSGNTLSSQYDTLTGFAPVDTTAPSFSSLSPSSSSAVTTTDVGYTLSEDIASGTVTYTRTGGKHDGTVHTVNLAGTELNSGTRNYAALTNAPTLVIGTIYTIAFNGTDAAGNSATEVSVTGIRFSKLK